MERVCGECSACCKALGVQELNKPPGKPCRHQKGGPGCRIYESRPLSCRGFVCAWMQGFGEENERPNITKIVLDCRKLPDPEDGSIIQMWEVKDGALDSDYAVSSRQRFLEVGYWVSHMPRNGQKKVFLPPDVSDEKVLEAYKEGKKSNFKVFSSTRTR